MDIKRTNFIKCNSPLGEWELHCTESQMQQIINDQEMLNALLGATFRKDKDVDRLKHIILEDKKELIQIKSIIDGLIKNGIPHSSSSVDCIDGSNESLRSEIKEIFK